MAQLWRRTEFPDLVIATGYDLATTHLDGGVEYHVAVGGFRGRLRDLLFDPSNGVGDLRGKVDFVACYVSLGKVPNYGGWDHGTEDAGRPFRGIMQMPGYYDLPADLPDKLGGKLGGIAHEFSHYWLVPGSGRIGSESLSTSQQTAASLRAGSGLPRYPVLGRQARHWSPYISLDSSVQEAGIHEHQTTDFERDVGASYSTSIPRTLHAVHVPGHGDIDVPRLGHLERYIMGFLSDAAAADEHFHVLRPRWVFPRTFETGLYVELGEGARWLVAFHRGPDRIAVARVGQPPDHDQVLSDPFNPYHRVAFRTVQRGDEVLLQARVFASPLFVNRAGCLWELLERLGVKFVQRPTLGQTPDDKTPLTCHEIMADLVAGPPEETGPITQGWTTLAQAGGRVARAGLFTRHLPGGAPFVRTTARLCSFGEQGLQSHPLADLDFHPGSVEDDPQQNCEILDDGTLVVPWNIHRRLDGGTDDAPRATLPAPPGDFAIGGEFEINECLPVTWAGGSGQGVQYVGERTVLTLKAFDYAAGGSAEAWATRRAQPAGDAYRFLFCLLLPELPPDGELLPRLELLDLMRRGWQHAFETIAPTDGAPRRADTALSAWAL